MNRNDSVILKAVEILPDELREKLGDDLPRYRARIADAIFQERRINRANVEKLYKHAQTVEDIFTVNRMPDLGKHLRAVIEELGSTFKVA